jgi:hypothetical protein
MSQSNKEVVVHVVLCQGFRRETVNSSLEQLPVNLLSNVFEHCSVQEGLIVQVSLCFDLRQEEGGNGSGERVLQWTRMIRTKQGIRGRYQA